MAADPNTRGGPTVAFLAALLVAGCNSPPTATSGSGPAAALHAVTGDAQTAPEGQPLPVPLTVQVLDAGGRGVAGVTVDWKVTAGGGSLLARTFPTVTDSEGLALVFWQLGSLGPQSVEATCCGSKETTYTAQAVLSFAQRLTIVSGTWQQDTVGHTLAQPIVVQVLRADGTPDGGAIVGWGTHTPGGRFSPTFARADSAGHASTMWTLGTVAGPETSWVGVRALPPVFVTAGVFPGPPARFTITPNPLPPMGVIGEYLSFISKAWDRYGNLVPAIVSLGAADTNIIGVNSGGDTLRGVQARHHGTTWLTEQIGVVRDSVPVTVLSFSAVSESGDRRCGLSPAGDAYRWGSNYLGAIGDGTQIDRSHPVLVGHGLALGLPSTDYETCALRTSGQAYCWGPDQAGELGDGSPNFASETFQTVPVPVAGGHVFSTIQAGGGFACALATSGDVYCWGGNEIGELGRDTVTATCAWGGIFRCSSWPVPVSGGLKFTLVSAGGDHSCASPRAVPLTAGDATSRAHWATTRRLPPVDSRIRRTRAPTCLDSWKAD